jgi:hypothetical protein
MQKEATLQKEAIFQNEVPFPSELRQELLSTKNKIGKAHSEYKRLLFTLGLLVLCNVALYFYSGQSQQPNNSTDTYAYLQPQSIYP